MAENHIISIDEDDWELRVFAALRSCAEDETITLLDDRSDGSVGTYEITVAKHRNTPWDELRKVMLEEYGIQARGLMDVVFPSGSPTVKK